MCTFKTWKKFGKPGKNLEKTSGNPVLMILSFFQRHLNLIIDLI